jgi:hypothetical protein
MRLLSTHRVALKLLCPRQQLTVKNSSIEKFQVKRIYHELVLSKAGLQITYLDWQSLFRALLNSQALTKSFLEGNRDKI